ncbi:myelin-oligodendrocyte glycoprotein-like isoform X1 [Thunnus maccoyii]|uniref:myelin-oligodendrocyte glycoprotein-like isoform X1 n=1 Tax=Thunnus maccoyii TaxID=8240 RepID=UPI001C4BA37A|nr:myelin-oligodendrocyte glycoprotein-like isoform X1 [Thunnus maccoyii]
MIHLTDGQSFRALLLYHIIISLLLLQSSAGPYKMAGPSQPIVAKLGDDIILPCHLEPEVSAVSMTLEWWRPDLNPKFVHVWRDGKDELADQNPSYKGRTSLFIEELKNGNVSLKLSKVELSDNGTYRCYIPTLSKESFITLTVDDIPAGLPTYAIVLIVIFMIIFMIICLTCAGACACATNGQVDCGICI